MIGRIVTVLFACCVAACAGPQTTDIRPTAETPAGCDPGSPGHRWKLRVVYDSAGAPIGVEPDAGNTQPIPDAANLEVKPCDTVWINARKGNAGRSAMVAFDKGADFKSPGRRPAYLARRSMIVVPIDKRDGSGKEEFRYSIHVDCPESECTPLDPMIIVER
jgi:hypothetical protein